MRGIVSEGASSPDPHRSGSTPPSRTRRAEWDSASAEHEFRRAIELSPSDAQAHLMFGFALIATGALEEARAEMARAMDLDPLSSFIPAYGSLLLYLAHQYDRAESEAKALIAAKPDFYLPHAYLGLIYEQTGRLREAIKEFETAYRLDENPEALAQLGHVHALAGDSTEAQRILGELHGMSVSRYVSPYNIALIFAGLEDREQTFAWLDKAVEGRFQWVKNMHVDPRLDGFHDDPRFQALLRRVGLPAVPR